MDHLLPLLPPNSCFTVDLDEYRQPVIEWRVMKVHKGRHILRFVRALINLGLLFAVPTFCLILIISHRDKYSWVWLLCWAGMCVPWLVGMGLYVASPRRSASSIQLASVTLTEAWLRYDPGGKGPFEEFARWLTSNVRIEEIDGRRRLIIETDTRLAEVGNFLSEPDREWLADVLRTWVKSGLTDPRNSIPNSAQDISD